MPCAAILGFLFGVFVSVLFWGGLLFTVKGMQRVGREAEARSTATKAISISVASENYSSRNSGRDQSTSSGIGCR
jgi:hypothetical protein